MAGGSNEEGEFGLQIAPMLDILFVLLLFFMVSAGIQKKEGELKTPLPGAGSAGPSTMPVTITIDSSNIVSINGGVTDQDHQGHLMPELEEKLKGIISESPDQPIIITPSRSTTHQRVMDVLSACKSAGITKVALSAPSG